MYPDHKGSRLSTLFVLAVTAILTAACGQTVETGEEGAEPDRTALEAAAEEGSPEPEPETEAPQDDENEAAETDDEAAGRGPLAVEVTSSDLLMTSDPGGTNGLRPDASDDGAVAFTSRNTPQEIADVGSATLVMPPVANQDTFEDVVGEIELEIAW